MEPSLLPLELDEDSRRRGIYRAWLSGVWEPVSVFGGHGTRVVPYDPAQLGVLRSRVPKLERVIFG